MRGHWNKTFVKSVNYSNFKYDLILESFNVLVSASFNASSPLDLLKIQVIPIKISIYLINFSYRMPPKPSSIP